MNKTQQKLITILGRYLDIDKGNVVRIITSLDLYEQYRSMASHEYVKTIKRLWRGDGPISKQSPECIHYVYKYLREIRERK